MSHKLFDLSGTTVLITGAGTGLGKHSARILSEVGARVVLCARRIDKLEQTAEEISQLGGNAICIPMDVTNAASISAAFDQAASHGPVTVVINCAGIAIDPLLLEMTEEQWDLVHNTNLKGTWMVGKEAAARMILNGSGGSIVNIASILSVCVQKGTGAYAASKAGVAHLTRSMALEWARFRIRVNAISPGYYESEMASGFINSDAGQAMLKGIPQRRTGTLEDLSGAVLLLSSDASAYMTGSTITVDGGHSLSMI